MENKRKLFRINGIWDENLRITRSKVDNIMWEEYFRQNKQHVPVSRIKREPGELKDHSFLLFFFVSTMFCLCYSSNKVFNHFYAACVALLLGILLQAYCWKWISICTKDLALTSFDLENQLVNVVKPSIFCCSSVWKVSLWYQKWLSIKNYEHTGPYGLYKSNITQ